jgi:hypothetical protein
MLSAGGTAQAATCSGSIGDFTSLGSTTVGSKTYTVYNQTCGGNGFDTEEQMASIATGLGDNLASIPSSIVNSDIGALITTEPVYIGFVTQSYSQSFSWTDGSSSTYTNWSAGNPNTSNTSGCEANSSCYVYAALLTTTGTWQWADQSIDAPSLDYGFVLESAAIATPLPAALPLFATGLGAFGLLAWRRKRKSAAIAA